MGKLDASLADLARAVVLGPTAENVVALADTVLASEQVRLALSVRQGGPNAARRAIELAALVLSEAPKPSRIEPATG